MTQIVLFACALVSMVAVSAQARTWTMAELDTLRDREWMWVDSKYKEPISEIFTGTVHPDVLPERFRYSSPDYPEAAMKTGAEGSVWLKVLVDVKGKARTARILEDSGLNVGFEEAALTSAKKSVWKPAMIDGKRIAIWVKYEVAFSLRVTDQGEPIRQTEHWHWSVRNPQPILDDSTDSGESLHHESPGLEEFVGLEEAPTQLKRGKVVYPEFARKAILEGSVWVEVLISRDGSVAEAMIVKESGLNCGFEESALYGAINSKWKPAIQDGVPVMLWVEYEISFRIKK
ncbi:MAG: energy transducer TonB [Candidatus Zixiibacteriota bacterium]